MIVLNESITIVALQKEVNVITSLARGQLGN